MVSVETGDDGGNMALVEFLDRGLEVRALLPLDEELRDLGAALHILGSHLAHLVLLDTAGATTRAALGLDMRGAEHIIGKLALVLTADIILWFSK
jgi:hypothetical protein